MTTDFGTYLEEMRKNKGFTLQGLATKIGVSPTYISDIEKGNRNPPPPSRIDDICEVLGDHIGYLKTLEQLERNRVVLSFDNGSQTVIDLALQLSSCWDHMTEEKAQRIIEIINEEFVYER